MKNEFCLGCRFLSVLDWLSEILRLDQFSFSCGSGCFSDCRKTWRWAGWGNAPACNNMYEMKMVLQCILRAFIKLINAETHQSVSRRAVGSLEVIFINALYSVQGWNVVNYRGRELLIENWLEISFLFLSLALTCDVTEGKPLSLICLYELMSFRIGSAG